MTPRTSTFELYIPTQGIGDIKAALSQITGLDAGEIPHPLQRRRRRLRRAQRSLSGVSRGDAGRQAHRQAGALDRHALGDDFRRSSRRGGRSDRRARARRARGSFWRCASQWLVNLGAYCSSAGALINTVAAPTSSATSLYKVPAVHGRHRLVFTNTTPITAYRGAGRPNVAYLWERLVEEAAVATRDRLRSSCAGAICLRKDAFPMKTPTGSHLRQRRSGAAAGYGARRRRTGTASKARREAAKQERQAARHRACDVSRAVRRRRQGADRDRVESDGRLSMFSQRRSVGAGPRDRVAGARREGSRLARGPDRAALQRRRDAEAHRHRHVRIALADQPRRRADERRQGDRREGQGACGAPSSRSRRTTSRSTNGIYRVAGTDLSISIRTLIEKKWGEAAASARHQHDASTSRPRFRAARTSPRSRSIRTPAHRRSSTTSRPTTAATSSITRSWRASSTAD